jgi:hypothetical protein
MHRHFIPPPLAGEGGERSEPGGGALFKTNPTPIALRALDPPLAGEG